MLKCLCGIADAVTALADDQQSAPPPGAGPLWGAGAPTPAAPAASRPSSGAPAGSGLDPLSRRLLRTAGVLSLLLIAVVANSLLKSDENPLNPVALAAQRAEKCPGFRFSLAVTYSTPAIPEPFTASGSGAYNARSERTLTELTIDSSLVGSLHIVEVDDSEYAYESGDTVDAQLPPGKQWVRTEKDAEDDEPSADLDEAMNMLGTSGGVHLVRVETIDGRSTRRYRAVIELGEFVQLLREKGKDEVADAYEGLEGVATTGVSAEAWVDKKNLLRRFRLVTPIPGGKDGGPSFTMDMRMDLFDFGAQPKIELPDPALVEAGPLESSDGFGSASMS